MCGKPLRWPWGANAYVSKSCKHQIAASSAGKSYGTGEACRHHCEKIWAGKKTPYFLSRMRRPQRRQATECGWEGVGLMEMEENEQARPATENFLREVEKNFGTSGCTDHSLKSGTAMRRTPQKPRAHSPTLLATPHLLLPPPVSSKTRGCSTECRSVENCVKCFIASLA